MASTFSASGAALLVLLGSASARSESLVGAGGGFILTPILLGLYPTTHHAQSPRSESPPIAATSHSVLAAMSRAATLTHCR